MPALLAIFLFIFGCLFSPISVLAAPLLDNTVATYTDDFANNTGVPTRSYVNVNTVTGVLQLTSSASQSTFTTPYKLSGSAISSVIKPLTLAKWNTLTINATVPVNTTLKVQILDDGNSVWQDEYVPGNSQGLDTSSPIDLSLIPLITCVDGNICNKPYSIKIKFLMTTADTLVTPTVDSILVSWSKNQGDLSSTTLSSDPWISSFGDQQSTRYSQYSNSKTYPAFKWASEKYTKDLYYTSMYVLKDKIIGFVSNEVNYLFARNRDTGSLLWKIPSGFVGKNGLIGTNGTYYGADMITDAAYALDTNSGQVKWVYDFMGGHGTGTIIGDDGTIYLIRNETVGNTAILYALNPDGSVKKQTTITLSAFPAEAHTIGDMSLGLGSVAYFVTSTFNSSTYVNTNHGKIFALNLLDGSFKWEVPVVDKSTSSPIIDSDGSIIVESSLDYSATLKEKSITAYFSDGTQKWKRSVTNTGEGYRNMILRKDGVILALNGVSSISSDPKKLEAIKTNDGSLLWSKDILSSVYDFNFSDINYGFYYSYNNRISTSNSFYANMNYFDSNGNNKWKISYPYEYLYDDKKHTFSLDIVRPDERGWLYGGFTKSVNTLSYDRVVEENFNQSYALAPWTLEVNRKGDNFNQGDTTTFTVTTSMLATNPLFGGDNKAQIVMDNGDKIPLSFSSTDSNGNTVWIGDYTIPNGLNRGTHSYSVELAQTNLQTDIETHFDSPPTESNNTGISLSESFTIGPAECTDIKPISTPNLYQIDVTNTSADVYFAPINDPVSHYVINYGTKENQLDKSVEVANPSYRAAIKATINGLVKTSTYFFSVKAVNGCREGNSSAPISVKVLSAEKHKFFPGKTIVNKEFKPFSIVPQKENLNENLLTNSILSISPSPVIQPILEQKQNETTILIKIGKLFKSIISFFSKK